MDAALNQLECECSPTDYKNAIKLLFVYVKNIHQNSTAEKYKKIRIGNEKFHSNVWRHETCRTILLLAGFEEVGDFIVLSNDGDVSDLYKLLEKQIADSGPAASEKSPTKPQGNPTLNLAAANKDGGLFATDLKADLTLLSYMMEMGYSKRASEKGLLATNNQGVQPAMDWITEHPECHHVDPEENNKKEQKISSSSSSSGPQTSTGIKTNVTSRLRMAKEQKHAYREKLRLQAIKKAKLDKEEDQLTKKYLVENLQSERQESKAKFEREKIMRHAETEEEENKGSTFVPSGVDMCALRIRMHNGETLMWETSKETSVKSLYSHVTSLMGDAGEEFQVCIPHPHQVLDVLDETSLQEKGLYPKATIVVQKLKQSTPDVAGSPATVSSEDCNATASGDDTNVSEKDTNVVDASNGENADGDTGRIDEPAVDS